MKNNKFKPNITNSKSIYKDPWIKVRLDKLSWPNGQETNYSVISLKGGIGVVPLTDDNKIVLVGQYRYAPDVYSWEIPKGAFPTFDNKLSPLEVAREELEEETGLSAKRWRSLAMIHTLMGSTNDKVYLFLAQELKQGNSHPDDTEVIMTKKVSFKKFFEMVEKEEITDSPSITAVSLVEKLLKKDTEK
jgi:8-oxo-dGTP pyrophosphatase MutT (NUDIX family)